MELVEATLVGLGIGPDAVAIERFETVVDLGGDSPPVDTDQAGQTRPVVPLPEGQALEEGNRIAPQE